MSKTAAAVAFLFMTLCSIPMSAQFFRFIPSGNAYAGISYGKLTDQVNSQSYKGWEGSAEFFAFSSHPHIGIVADGSGYYRSGVRQYLGVGGFRLSTNYYKWRPFVQAMAGVRHVTSYGFIYNPILIDVGGGADYKLHFKNFSWRVQGDYLHSNYGSAVQNDFRASTGLVWRF